MTEFWLSGLVAASCYTLILIFLLSGLGRLPRTFSRNSPPVSVIIAAHNEADSLHQCLTALDQQNYPKSKTEIIVIDDRSDDETALILRKMQTRYENLGVVTITETPDARSPKKHALEQGIRRASADILLMTDADCSPAPEWISSLVARFGPGVGLVAGAAPFARQSGFLAGLLGLENLFATLTAAGTIGWNFGLTCTGRSLAYRRSAFEAVAGFERIHHSISGDDDLLMQLVDKETDWRLAYCLEADAAVLTESATRWSDWLAQRRRHVSAARYFSRGAKLFYLIWNGCAAIILVNFLVQILSGDLLLAIMPLLMKWVVDFLGLFWVTRSLRNSYLLKYFLPWQLFTVFNQFIVSPLAFFGKITWK